MKQDLFITLIFFLFVSSCSINRSSKEAGIKEGVKPHVNTDSVKVRVVSAVGMRQIMLDLVPKFEQATGYRIDLSFNSSGEIVKSVDSGKPIDIAIIFRAGIEQLAATERVMVSSVTNLAVSHVGVAVRKGAPVPDISSTNAFKAAMLGAKTIACPDPALGGASGVHIAKIFERLAIAEALKSKLVLSSTPDDEKAMPGYLVASGKAEIAIHQMQELMAVDGIDIIGPLPDDLQTTFVFTAAITTHSKYADAAKALIRFLCTPEAKAIIKSKGMTLPVR